MDVIKYYYDGLLHDDKPFHKDEYFAINLVACEFIIKFMKGDTEIYNTSFGTVMYDIKDNSPKVIFTYYSYSNYVMIKNSQYKKIIVDLHELLKSQVFNEEACRILDIVAKYLGDLYEQCMSFHESVNCFLIEFMQLKK